LPQVLLTKIISSEMTLSTGEPRTRGTIETRPSGPASQST